MSRALAPREDSSEGAASGWFGSMAPSTGSGDGSATSPPVPPQLVDQVRVLEEGVDPDGGWNARRGGVPAGAPEARIDRLRRLEDLPAIAGEVDLRPRVGVRLADEEGVVVLPLARREAGGEACRQAERSGHHHHRDGEVLAVAAAAELGIEEEEVHADPASLGGTPAVVEYEKLGSCERKEASACAFS